MAVLDASGRVTAYLPVAYADGAFTDDGVETRVAEAAGLFDISEDITTDWSGLRERQRLLICLQAALLLIPPSIDFYKGKLLEADGDGPKAKWSDRVKSLAELAKQLAAQLKRAADLEGFELEVEPTPGWTLLEETLTGG